MADLRSVSDLRKFLGFESNASVYRLVHRGEIAFVRIGPRMMFEASAIAAYLSSRRHQVLLNDGDSAGTESHVRAVPGDGNAARDSA